LKGKLALEVLQDPDGKTTNDVDTETFPRPKFVLLDEFSENVTDPTPSLKTISPDCLDIPLAMSTLQKKFAVTTFKDPPLQTVQASPRVMHPSIFSRPSFPEART
jgi:hypothetical protein